MPVASLDLRRQPFGKWTVIRKGDRTIHGQFWECVCACNPAVTVVLVEAALLEGWTQSCGCDYVDMAGCRHPVSDWTGQQVGKRLVLGVAHTTPRAGRHKLYHVRCACGKEQVVSSLSLGRGRKQCLSCAKRKPLGLGKWGAMLVEACVGTNKHRHTRYRCRFQDGSLHIVDRKDILSGRVTGGAGKHPNYGKVAAQPETVMALWAEGFSQRAIAQKIGVSPEAVRAFLDAHGELIALAASLPDDEMLVSEVS